jgi:hypothetical protein
MAKYPYAADIEVSRLRLDLKNPRLPGEPDSQREAFEQMAAAQNGKLLALAKHIARHGLSPAYRFLVIPDDDNQFIVLDANRRLTALRALEQPELVAAGLTESERRQLKLLADSFDPLEDVPCFVFEKREDADVWIELLHEGESEGAGLVEWTAQQKARHRARSGTKPAHLQVLEFVMAEGTPSPDAIERHDRGTYPVSTLERALTTPHVRQQLGIEILDGQVVTGFPKPEVLKGLTKLVDEIGTGKVKVGQVMRVEDRKAYIDAFNDDDLPDPRTRAEGTVRLDEAPEKARTQRPVRDRQSSSSRTKLIPVDFLIRPAPARINDIYLELKRKIRVDDTPNAAGVLLRVFLELSVDEYMAQNQVPPPTGRDKERLDAKVLAVLGYMEAQSLMTSRQSIPVREAFKSDDKLTLATNLNALVHNRDMALSGNDLKQLWTRLEVFFQKLWG